MKEIITIVFFLFFVATANSQIDSVRGRQFKLTGKIAGEIQMTPHCGTLAWATVIKFEIIDISGLKLKNHSIWLIVTCPELYGKDFFQKGQVYSVVVSNTNQANFSYGIFNEGLLKQNKLSFKPYVVAIQKANP